MRLCNFIYWSVIKRLSHAAVSAKPLENQQKLACHVFKMTRHANVVQCDFQKRIRNSNLT